MPARESQLKGRLRLRHLFEVTEAKGEELAELAPRFERLADSTAAPRVVSAFNLFQTPTELAERLAGMFPRWGRTLEPSAGLGRLYQAIRTTTADHVTLVEIAAECAGELYRITADDPDCQLIQADFLGCDRDRLGGGFDSVLMNPPFCRGLDVKHIRHAVTLLNPGGQLVSVCAAGPKQRAAFQGVPGWDWIDLPAGTFREAATNVETAIVIYRNPL